MKVVAFVPLKLESVRLPNKATLPLGGVPLYKHLLNTLCQVRSCSEIYVFCSDDSLASDLPAGVQFLQRSKSLDADETLGAEIYQAFIEKVSADIYLLAHVTSPFITVQSIEAAIDHVSGDYDSAFTVRKIQNFVWYKSAPVNYDLSKIPRTQDLEPVYEECSAFFCFKAGLWTESRRRIGDKHKMVELGHRESVDIDTWEDFELAKALL